MIEEHGNLWDKYDDGETIIITTNGFVKNNGEAVMGRGIALEAKKRFPTLPLDLGSSIRNGIGNHVEWFNEYDLITFPVKHNWWEEADILLIDRSCRELMKLVEDKPWLANKNRKIYMPRPGCGNGKLEWTNVRLTVDGLLDDRFVVTTF